ncbi:hypothetical protein IFR05_000504 [Cadophora sp. M221]|nr:hypothetical protein IFR05_000504 [Cadophora sp. M221]
MGNNVASTLNSTRFAKDAAKPTQAAPAAPLTSKDVEQEAMDALGDLEGIAGKGALLRLILDKYDSTLEIKNNVSMMLEAIEGESRQKLLQSYHLGIRMSREATDEISRQLRLNDEVQSSVIRSVTSSKRAITLADSFHPLPTKAVRPQASSYLDMLKWLADLDAADTQKLEDCRQLMELHLPWLLGEIDGILDNADSCDINVLLNTV